MRISVLRAEAVGENQEGRTRTFKAHRFGRHVCVLESASGIKEHDAIGRFEESCREQIIVRGSRCSSFGR